MYLCIKGRIKGNIHNASGEPALDQQLAQEGHCENSGAHTTLRE